MVIQFPHRKPIAVESPKTNWTGLYVLLVVGLLYLTGVWLAQHYGSRPAASPKPLVTSPQAR